MQFHAIDNQLKYLAAREIINMDRNTPEINRLYKNVDTVSNLKGCRCSETPGSTLNHFLNLPSVAKRSAMLAWQ
jgi:hypothetical protein